MASIAAIFVGCSSSPTDADRVIAGTVEGIELRGNFVSLEVTGVIDECGGVIIVDIEPHTEVRRLQPGGTVVPAAAEDVAVGSTIRALPFFIAQSCPPQYGVTWVEIQP